MSSGGESWALLWDVFGRPSVQQVPLALSRGNGGELFFVFGLRRGGFVAFFGSIFGWAMGLRVRPVRSVRLW